MKIKSYEQSILLMCLWWCKICLWWLSSCLWRWRICYHLAAHHQRYSLQSLHICWGHVTWDKIENQIKIESHIPPVPLSSHCLSALSSYSFTLLLVSVILRSCSPPLIVPPLHLWKPPLPSSSSSTWTPPSSSPPWQPAKLLTSLEPPVGTKHWQCSARC